MKMMNPYIFKEFNIDVRRCYKRRGIYICETRKGTKAIRKTAYNPDQITFQSNIQQYLYNNGFQNQNKLCLTMENKPYVINKNTIYTMTDWSNTSKIDLKNINDIKQGIQIMANMHYKGRGFVDDIVKIETVRFKNIGETYEKRYRENRRLRKKINNTSSKTDFEVLYLQHVEEYMSLQKRSLELVTKSDYSKLITKAKKDLTIAHRKYTNYNIVKAKDNSIKVAGFQKSNYDVQLVDLASLSRKVMDKNNWDIDLLMLIIDEYIKICPLTLSEWEILKGMIVFPVRFSSICNTYCNTKRKLNYNMFYRKFSKILKYKQYYIVTAQKLLDK